MKISDLPGKVRRKVQKVIDSMNLEERSVWDEMANEDEEMLIEILLCQFSQWGTVGSLDHIKTHFRVARLIDEAMTVAP